MKTCGGVDVYTHVFLTSTLVEGECLASRPDRFTSGERVPSTHYIGGWMGPRGDLDDVEKRRYFTLPGLEIQNVSLYLFI
jgi:hypothetical protein